MFRGNNDSETKNNVKKKLVKNQKKRYRLRVRVWDNSDR